MSDELWEKRLVLDKEYHKKRDSIIEHYESLIHSNSKKYKQYHMQGQQELDELLIWYLLADPENVILD